MSRRPNAAGYVVGTCHFVSWNRARDYYAPYGFDAVDVRQKIEAGEIAIGKPKHVPEADIFVIENEGRYAIRVRH